MAAAGRARVALAALVLLAAPRRGHSQAAKAKHPCKADELMKECGLLMDQIKDSSKGLDVSVPWQTSNFKWEKNRRWCNEACEIGSEADWCLHRATKSYDKGSCAAAGFRSPETPSFYKPEWQGQTTDKPWKEYTPACKAPHGFGCGAPTEEQVWYHNKMDKACIARARIKNERASGGDQINGIYIQTFDDSGTKTYAWLEGIKHFNLRQGLNFAKGSTSIFARREWTACCHASASHASCAPRPHPRAASPRRKLPGLPSSRSAATQCELLPATGARAAFLRKRPTRRRAVGWILTAPCSAAAAACAALCRVRAPWTLPRMISGLGSTDHPRLPRPRAPGLFFTHQTRAREQHSLRCEGSRFSTKPSKTPAKTTRCSWSRASSRLSICCGSLVRAVRPPDSRIMNPAPAASARGRSCVRTKHGALSCRAAPRPRIWCPSATLKHPQRLGPCA